MRNVILIIDDDPAMLAFMRYQLQDYDVITATNGEVGFDLIRAYQPKVIISDYVMPALDGLGLLKRLHTDAELSQIPVFIATTSINPKIKTDCLAHGAIEVFRKPLAIDELRQRVAQFIA